MHLPPKYLGGTKVLEFTAIDNRHIALNTATLEVASAHCGPASYLAICFDESDNSHFLYFCDARWNIWNDCWFQDIQDAKEYVESQEYAGTKASWQRVENT
jgi:hypothetical protein